MSGDRPQVSAAADALLLEDRKARFADPLERLLYLRLESQLRLLSGHELSLLAQHSEAHCYGVGEKLMIEGAPAPAIHFLVEGRVALRRDGVTYLRLNAPALVGMVPVLSQEKRGVEALAEQPVITLAVQAHVLLDLVEDNFRFMEGALRGVSQQLQICQRKVELAGHVFRAQPKQVQYPKEPLDLIARLKFMRRGVYAEVNLEPLIELIRGAEEVRFGRGQVVWRAGEPSTYSLHVVYGVIQCEAADGLRSFRMGPDSVVGVLEANANLDRSYQATAETEVVAIRTRVEDFFDVLEDHTQLGMGLLSALCSRLLELQRDYPIES